MRRIHRLWTRCWRRADAVKIDKYDSRIFQSHSKMNSHTELQEQIKNNTRKFMASIGLPQTAVESLDYHYSFDIISEVATHLYVSPVDGSPEVMVKVKGVWKNRIGEMLARSARME